MSNSDIKVYILADTEEDYLKCLKQCELTQSDFVYKHRPEWSQSPPMIEDEHVEFIDARKYSVWVQDNGYEFTIV